MRYLLLFSLIWVCPFPLFAQTGESNGRDEQPLVVATRQAPPFSIRGEDGRWTGISIDIWDAVAKKLNLQYSIVEIPNLSDLLEAVEKGAADVAVSSLTLTAERERHMDFSHTFYASGLSIATTMKEDGGWLKIINSAFSLTLLRAMGGLALVLFVFGLLVWLLERRKNVEQFGGHPLKGIGAGFWWSAVTMTTVGYGDKAPMTLAGRLVGLIWMFSSVILVSGFTGAIASALTVTSMAPTIGGPRDLHSAKVGVLSSSAAEEYFDGRQMDALRYASTREGLAAVERGEIKAFVNDAPVLRYQVHQDYTQSLTVLPGTFNPAYYAYAFPLNSPIRSRVNLALLKILDSGEWHKIVHRYVKE